MIGTSTKYIMKEYPKTLIVLTEFSAKHYEYHFEKKDDFKVFSKDYRVHFPRLARKVKFVSAWQGKSLLKKLQKFEKSLDK